MTWEVPSFVEIRMDAEIGAYQDDFGTLPDVTPTDEDGPTRVNASNA
jgi:hypothetical protein